MTSRNRSGFSLTEAVIACFLLANALLMAVWLFDASLQSLGDSEQRQVAALLADNTMDEMRNFLAPDFSVGLDSYNGVTRRDPLHPGFTITTRAELHPLASPCTTLEEAYPATASYPTPERKVLEESAWQAEVTVAWSDRASDRVVVNSLLGDWRKPDFTVTVEPGGVTLPPEGTADFQASARDGAGHKLPDLVFTWYVAPYDGIGSIANVSRDGQRATYQNHVRTYGGEFEIVPGKCEVRARGYYRGQVVQGGIVVENQ
ncbi:MAG: hypothetical protein KC910_01745 [Candidatus Eremiobacteraeota bacterium]|nr:hypothetical protein [Candidatus Eremiobacteraeota bacterium]